MRHRPRSPVGARKSRVSTPASDCVRRRWSRRRATHRQGGAACISAWSATPSADGDVWLFDRTTRTLVAGDLVTLSVPLFDTACSAGWQDALRRLDDVDFVKLVPGHGAVMDHARFRIYRGAYDRLLACAASDAPADACKAGWLHDAQSLIPAPDLALADPLLDYYITQVLRAGSARRDKYCHRESHE